MGVGVGVKVGVGVSVGVRVEGGIGVGELSEKKLKTLALPPLSEILIANKTKSARKTITRTLVRTVIYVVQNKGNTKFRLTSVFKLYTFGDINT